MHITATEAKNRFGSVCTHGKREPVFMGKAGPVDTVTLSVEHHQALLTSQTRSTLAARKAAREGEFGG